MPPRRKGQIKDGIGLVHDGNGAPVLDSAGKLTFYRGAISGSINTLQIVKELADVPADAP